MQRKELIRVVAAEIEREGSFLITQRREKASFPLLWEFPSGRVEEGESDEKALCRELKERLGVDTEVGECTMFVKHDYPEYVLHFYVYQCSLSSDADLKSLKVKDWRWVHPGEMESYPFPPADAETIKALIEKESEN